MTVTIVGTATNTGVICPTNLMVTRTWRAVDRCGNESDRVTLRL